MQIELEKYKRILVVSPHLDDGVLSVGGLIEKAAGNGADVVVATAFTADMPPGEAISPLASELHELWNLGQNPFSHRRNEDAAAAATLGARVFHGQLLDALYRTDKEGNSLYPTRQSVFSEPSGKDEIVEALFQLYNNWHDEFSPNLVLSPLGVGRHVDHILTSNAVQRLAKTRPVTVVLYEDMPYSTGLFPVAAPDTVDAALERTTWQVTEPQFITVGLPGKLRAIAAYASQIADIFPDGLDVEAVLDDYMRDTAGTHGERIWMTAR